MALLLVVFAMSCFCTSIAPAIGACDGNKACIGRAYTASVATGQNHHYVNVAASPSLRGISAQMTVEMWINASRQSGGRVLIAGIWGPYTDDNDVWVLYISPSDELTFEVNGPLDRGALDNTIARAPFVAYYGRWTHIAATFDAGTVRLYINGVLQDSAYNQQYPATQVRQPRNPSSALKIGSINGFFDSPSNRAFIGQLDEIRIWTRTLQRQEIACNRFRSLEGNEPGLVLYFRCNEQENDFLTPLCDASGNGNNGRLFSGATCRPPSPARTIPRSVTMAPQAINEQLDCDSSRTWTLTLADTTECGSTVSLSIGGRDRSFFRVVPNTIMLPPGGVPMTATVSYNGYLTGTIQAFVRIVGGNRCSYSDTIRFQLTRRTELAYTPARIAFDTLFARCPSRAYLDTTIRICNESALLGTARAVTITGALTRLTSVFRAFPAGGRTFPLVLQPGECADIVVRFSAQDTTLLFLDTLFILSTDRCPGNGIIPLSGQTQQVFAIRRPNGSTPITSFQFPGTCPGDLSSPQAWNWYNMTGRNLIIDSVVYPRVLVAVRMPRFPYTLPPSNQTGEFEKYFRFRPLQPGVVRDSVVFYARLPGEPCQFVIVIPLTGRGLDKDVEFAATAIDFGNVIVGQEARRDVVLRNNSSTDVLTVSLYLKRGEEFVLLQRNVQVAPLQTRTLTNILAFRPTNAVDYTDTLCLFEQRCYMSGCIPIRGRGIIEKFRYEPPVLQVERVLSCDSSSAIIEIINESSIEQQLTNLRLDDPSGTLFTIDTITGARIQLPPSLRISPGGRVRIAIRFVPSSRGNDIAVVGFIRYRSASGEDWMVQVRANSITPKLYVTPTTDYGTIEVGEVRDNLVAIENISPVPVRIDRVNVPIGFTIQSISPPLPVVLSQRDSLMVIVRFAPAAVGTFNAPITVESDSPCVAIRSNGELRGRAIIYRLDAPISIQNFSYVRPCECIVREIPLANNSVVHPMTIDSLVIDSIGIPNATPQLFTFTSTYYEQNSRNLPYTIPPQTTDTLRIVFCPRTAADTSQVVASARLRIVAHGVGWNDRYDVYLIGRRALTFRPSPTQFSFPITLVDVDAAVNPNSPPVSRLTIPSLTWNPFQDTVQIDSITFIPDERVFRYTLTDERNRPVTLPYRLIPGTSASLNIRFDFRPRAPRTYRARVGIYYSKPCIDLDTTIFLVGIGAAGFPYAMYLQFDSSGVALDTFRVISCDTLHVPVYASRALPKTSAQRSLIDFACRFTYDTTKLKLIGVTPGYNATLQTLTYDSAGAVARLEKLLDVDSLGRMLIAHFIPLRRQRDTATIEIGEFDFNTTEILRYDLSTTRGDRALVIIEAATITLMNPPSQGVVSFDSVRVLDCDQRQIVIRNTGDVPLTIDSLLNLPPTMRAIAFVPDRSVPRLPGEETIVTIEYCPRDFSHVDTLSVIVSTNPCRCADTLRILGKGYAPPFPLRITTDPSNPANPSARGGTLGDTITIPLLLDRDVAASYHGTTYWLEAFSFGFRVQWNPTMLKYLGIESRLPNGVLRDTFGFPATLHAGIHRVPTMRGDTFALLRFRIAVPDTISDVLVIEPTAPVQTDSLLFLDVQLLGSTTPTLAGGKCGVTIARPGTPGGFLIVEPNPADNRVRLSIALEEYTSPTVEFLSISGNRSIYARDFGTLAPGVHTLEISTAELPTGVYRVIVSAGVVRASGMVVVLH